MPMITVRSSLRERTLWLNGSGQLVALQSPSENPLNSLRRVTITFLTIPLVYEPACLFFPRIGPAHAWLTSMPITR
jgi:hypothetical protein